jgi:hypothetical protein
MAALGVGALVGFALDALWHEAYRIDVTLWSPTHLMLVGGGGLPTIAVRLILIEGRPAGRATAPGRAIAALSLGAILVGLSCFEGEFDFGVPQFQVICLPVLIAATAGFALVLARAALGPRAARRTDLAGGGRLQRPSGHGGALDGADRFRRPPALRCRACPANPQRPRSLAVLGQPRPQYRQR